MDSISESDWKWLRELRPVILERYCQSILNEVVRLAADDAGTALERYHQLWKLIKERDSLITDAFDDHRRSTAFWKILALRSKGLLTDEEFHTFSRETCGSIERIVKPQQPDSSDS
jgi:hypothetical protein